MSRFYICELNGIRFLTKLCFYRKTPPEIYGKIKKNVVSHTDAEINILKVFKNNIIDKNMTHCILELVYSKVCTGLSKITPKNNICEQVMLDSGDTDPGGDVEQLLCKYSDLVKNDLAYDKCAFLVLDRCDMTLDDYLRKNVGTSVSIAVFKSLLFQIIYTIYVITKIYPGFRHYDLHTENIMLKFDQNYKFKMSNPKYLIFTVNDVVFSVPYFGIVPKIIDFGFSALPEEGIISNATEDRAQMYFRSQNDILFLFHCIHLTLGHGGGDRLGNIDKILQKLEPNRTYIQYYTEYIRKVEESIPTYKDMIYNNLWDEYKTHKVSKNQIYIEFAPIKDSSKK